MLDALLVAQAARNETAARYLCRNLDLTRTPRDAGDKASIVFFKKAVPWIEQHPGDAVGLREGATEPALRSLLDYALFLPTYLVERCGTVPELIRAFNEPGASYWRPKIFRDTENAGPAPTSAARLLRHWLDDLALLRPPVATIPHLAIQGRVTLLSGREKMGKSTLVAGVVAAASRGDDVLGVTLGGPVRTLWYALDEPVGDCVRRFRDLHANLDHIVINAAPRTSSELLAAIEQDVAAFPGITLVVVDTLSRVFASSDVDPNSSRDVEPIMARLVDQLHRLGVSAILLYHTGKGGKEYRGSTAIGATVDDILTLRRRGSVDEDDFDDDGTDDGRRLLVQDGRNLRGRLHLTCEDGRYRLYDDAMPPRLRILETLRDHGSVANRSELIKLAGGRRQTGMKAVAEMIEDGSISESGRVLKLTSLGSAELSSRPSPRAEPAGLTREFPSSHKFPEGGTGPEPGREPKTAPISPSGSRFLHPHPAKTGTAPPVGRQPQLRVAI